MDRQTIYRPAFTPNKYNCYKCGRTEPALLCDSVNNGATKKECFHECIPDKRYIYGESLPLLISLLRERCGPLETKDLVRVTGPVDEYNDLSDAKYTYTLRGQLVRWNLKKARIEGERCAKCYSPAEPLYRQCLQCPGDDKLWYGEICMHRGRHYCKHMFAVNDSEPRKTSSITIAKEYRRRGMDVPRHFEHRGFLFLTAESICVLCKNPDNDTIALCKSCCYPDE